MYVLDHTLPYIILGMPELSKYDITIDCSKQKICQNGKNLNKSQNDKSHSNDKDKQNVSLHISECKQINSHCSQTTEDQVNPPQSVTENKCELRKEVKDIIKNFDSVFSKDKYDVGALRVEPQRIVLNSDLPVSLRPYRTSPVEEQEIKSQVEKLLQAGLIKESNSPYSSPVTLAFKRDEGKKTRLCIDFRKLNALCKSDSEPLPLMDSLLDKLSKAKIFSSLDLASGYWHVPIHPKDTEKLAFCTNFGLYEWCRLPFGIKVAPAIFNRLIRRILTKYKIDFACNYFDDIIVYSSSELEHWKHLKTIFEICEKENIKLKLSKCVFAQTKISFLGYEIEQGKVSPNNANIETIKKLQPPTNVKELQRFLGSVNVYNKFIPQYAKLRFPLNQLLKKDVKFNWTNECQDAFDKLKETLTTKPVLNLYNPDVTYHVFVDASQKSVGAVLKQPDASDVLHPIAYHSRTLRDYEKNYAITELECLAIVDALDKFYYYLHGQKFVFHTDHAALVWLKNVKNLRGRLFRWSLKLSMFDYEIKYQKGCTNIEADMLSRHTVSHHLQHAVHLLDMNEIKTQQKNDNLCGPKYHEVKDVIVIKKRNLYKIVVPFSLRLKLLNQAHEQFGHPGVQKMLNLITPQYYWPNITSDITKFVKHCCVCQLNKNRKQKRFGLLQQVPPTSIPFECISVDTVGGFNYYNSTKKFLHIVIDHATRHVWAFPSKNENSETYINILKQIFQIQVPVKLLTDRNAAFTSSRFKKFLRNYNVKHLLTTAHHPQTNGKVERVNQSLVTRLKCKVNSTSTKVPWTKLLESVTNEYNLTPYSITKYPPAYLLLGTLPYDSPIGQNSYYEPVNEARNLALQRTIDYHNKNKIRYDARFVDKKFNPGDLVVYEEFHYPNTRKLSPPFSGPYEVIKQCSEVTYEINKPNPLTKQATQIVHISKLRCFHSPEKLKLSHD
ncbi:Transposon Tf2-6 polyprotein [Araneus ventricosus]|uniref:RNA-directed DNA polymerase n=1 Tax=Araneus ventricosus TaxID=182803 RepID=A0A4Y2WNS0_ARAVE|nr:Transposon Tf2-6 polyprotein [Araneus ventricosus]GBO38358.1 Transposon Tf2-6 polyprotein [Araneus ventricosus]